MAHSFALVSSVVSSRAEDRGPAVCMSVDAYVGADQRRVEDLFRAIIRRLEMGDLDALEGWVAEKPVVSASETEPSLLWLAVKDLTDEQRKRVLDAVALRDMRGDHPVVEQQAQTGLRSGRGLTDEELRGMLDAGTARIVEQPFTLGAPGGPSDVAEQLSEGAASQCGEVDQFLDGFSPDDRAAIEGIPTIAAALARDRGGPSR